MCLQVFVAAHTSAGKTVVAEYVERERERVCERAHERARESERAREREEDWE